MRGLLGEYGVILPQGAWPLSGSGAGNAIAAAELSDLTRELFGDPALTNSALSISGSTKLDRQLLALCRTNEACRRLSKAGLASVP